MRKIAIRITVFVGLFCLLGSNAEAILIDPYDNIPAPDGIYGLLYGNYYHADEFTNAHGSKAASADLSAELSVMRILAYKNIGNWLTTFQLIVPFGQLEETKLLDEKSSGVGDVVFGPGVFLYQNDAIKTYVSYWFYIFAPTGEWDKNQTINLGGNHWYFEHQLAFNAQLGKFVYDMNLNYYHHTEEPDNNLELPDRFEIETSLGYQVTERLIVGFVAGGYVDLGRAEMSGNVVPDSKAERWQVGPCIGYTLTDRLCLNLRWTNDVASSNDSKGDDIWLRVAYAF